MGPKGRKMWFVLRLDGLGEDVGENHDVDDVDDVWPFFVQRWFGWRDCLIVDEEYL